MPRMALPASVCLRCCLMRSLGCRRQGSWRQQVATESRLNSELKHPLEGDLVHTVRSASSADVTAVGRRVREDPDDQPSTIADPGHLANNGHMR